MHHEEPTHVPMRALRLQPIRELGKRQSSVENPRRFPIAVLLCIATPILSHCASVPTQPTEKPSESAHINASTERAESPEALDTDRSQADKVPTQLDRLEGAVAIAAGDHSTCAILQGGRVACWGRIAKSVRPVLIEDVTAAESIAMDGQRACVRHTDKRVTCWGKPLSGRVRGAAISKRPTPIQEAAGADALDLTKDAICFVRNGDVACLSARKTHLPSLDDAVEVAVTYGAICVRRREGQVHCWKRSKLTNPAQETLPPPLAEDAVEMDLQNNRICILGKNGTRQCAGTSRFKINPQLDLLADVTHHRWGGWGPFQCGIASSGNVLCKGTNSMGQLGRPKKAPSGSVGSVVGIDDARDLALGHSHGCALRDNGRIACWGLGTDGQLGNDAVETAKGALGVDGIDDATAIWAGWDQSCARRATGQVVCWGDPDLDPRAVDLDSPSTPYWAVEGVIDPTEISIGQRHACAITQAGVQCWGSNSAGQLGTVDKDTSKTTLKSVEGAARLATGPDFSYAWTAEGRTHRWGAKIMHFPIVSGGQNTGAAVGNPIDVTCERRQRVGTPCVKTPTVDPDLSVVQLSTEETKTCAIDTEGVLWCWGKIESHRHASGWGPKRQHPDLAQAQDLCSTREQTFVLTQEGKIERLARSPRRPKSDRRAAHSSKYNRLADGAQITRLNCGGHMICADITQDLGKVKLNSRTCWSLSSHAGQRRRPTRSQIPTNALEDTRPIALGDDHGCLLQKGRVVCVGDNSRGQLGIGRESVSFRATSVVAPER